MRKEKRENQGEGRRMKSDKSIHGIGGRMWEEEN